MSYVVTGRLPGETYEWYLRTFDTLPEAEAEATERVTNYEVWAEARVWERETDREVGVFVRKRPVMFELFYSTGGHGGPYHSETEAVEAAGRLLHGNAREEWIDVREYSRRGYSQVKRIVR